jgi:phosphatidyl-myo-inositol alpha-mannosyltransferase
MNTNTKLRERVYFSTYDDIKNPHYGGGGAVAVHEVAKRLSHMYTVQVVSWDYSGRKKETIDGVSYERFGLKFFNPKLAMAAYQLTLPFIMRNKKFSVWIESFCPPFTTAFLPIFTKKPVVGIVHMLAAEDMERKYPLPFHLIQNSGLKKYMRLIITSDAMKKNLNIITPKSTVTVISNGIQKVFKPLMHKEKYILFLGRIEVNQKGIDLLIEAFAWFHEKNNEYKLIIAGTGNKKETALVRELITKYHLHDSVVLKGKVTGAKKEELLRQAKCVVIPSRFETYSLVALEAMAHGAPVVCFKIKGLSWIPDGIAKKVQPFSPSGLSRTLSDLVTDTKSAHTMTVEGYTYAKKFTWDSIAKQYQEYIENIMSKQNTQKGDNI